MVVVVVVVVVAAAAQKYSFSVRTVRSYQVCYQKFKLRF